MSTTTRFESSITEDDNLLPMCNIVTAKYNVNGGFLFHFRCRFIVECAYDKNNNNNRFDWDIPRTRNLYMPDTSVSSYESVKLIVSDLFTEIGLPEDEQIRTINSMCSFFRIHSDTSEAIVPMFLDLAIVTVLQDVKAASNWMMWFSSLDDDIKTVPATECSIQALEKLTITDGGECCVVCLEELVVGSEVSCMPCKHVFHDDCIAHWLRTMHACPVCRYAMPYDKINAQCA